MTPDTPFDTRRTFVQVVERRRDGFVEFRFAIGDPSLYVEMLLTEAAFTELCALHHATVLDDAVPGDPADDWAWSMHDATHTRFTSNRFTSNRGEE